MSRLIFQLPDQVERLVPLHRGETLTIGRDPRHAIAINDITVSRLHAQVSCDQDGTCLLEDLRSHNGTTLNNVRLAKAETLQDGDRLSFGRITATYLAPDDARMAAREYAVGDTLAGRYRLERSLGETNEYETFCATDTAAGAALVAVTIFARGLNEVAGSYDRDRERFARICAAPHPGLVRLLDFQRWRWTRYLVSEWIESRSLLDLLRRRSALTLPGALRLVGLVAAVTDHARAQSLPAPDLSPRAVLLSLGRSLSDDAWQQIFDSPVEQWPAFTLKIIPRLFAPTMEGPWPLGTLLCDLLGHPPTQPGGPPPSRLACLGEKGNEILAQGFSSSREVSGSDARFVEELTKAVVPPARKPAGM